VLAVVLRYYETMRQTEGILNEGAERIKDGDPNMKILKRLFSTYKK
jgi:hypothetical protein